MAYAFNYAGLQVHCETVDELLEMLTRLKLLRQCDIPSPLPPASTNYRGLSQLKAAIAWLQECGEPQTVEQISYAIEARGVSAIGGNRELRKGVRKALKLRGGKYGAVKEGPHWKLIGALKA